MFEDKKSKFLVIFVICLSYSSFVICDDLSSIGIQSRQQGSQQQTIQRPIDAVNTSGNVNAKVNTTKPQTTASGNIVVELQTPAPTPSNIISIINVKPSGTATIRPIQTTQRPNINVNVSTSRTTARPIQTTQRPNINVNVSTSRTTARPIQTTQRPNINVTVSTSGTTARQITAQTTGPSSCPLVNIMGIKTGLLAVANDPCSYVSCIRTGNTLYCAHLKCDPGQAFAPTLSQCLPSLLCPK
ncbi:uncharacterized protein LOC116338134 [Contarinia nasturtii]|uniref:uncharacterized protein LOC116338134 n=1 Tax=Contarinia nasturtii TaxID=265458 RepID=UPI0012D4365A|nr:uncharacterized protein LOC116338134 [Contarinia nasturtii]